MKPYRDALVIVKARARAQRLAGREPNHWVPTCDNIDCDVCRKARGEKSPQNR